MTRLPIFMLVPNKEDKMGKSQQGECKLVSQVSIILNVTYSEE